MSGRVRPDLSIVLPAFNEEERVGLAIGAAVAFGARRGRCLEILVVDDGSVDGTAAAARACRARVADLRVLAHATNRGKGAAVRTGMLAARGAHVLFADVDLSTSFEAYDALWREHVRGHDVVIASRDAPGARRVVPQPWHRRAMGRAFAHLRGHLVLPGFRDTQCGFKSFTAAAAQRLFRLARLDGFCFDVEVLALARHLGLSVAEVGVPWTDDPRSSVAPVRDGLRALADLAHLRRHLRRLGAQGVPAVTTGRAAAPGATDAGGGDPAYSAVPGGAHAAFDDPGGR